MDEIRKEILWSLHRMEKHGAEDLRSDDLIRLADAYPILRPLLEEIEFLRARVDELEDTVETHRRALEELEVLNTKAEDAVTGNERAAGKIRAGLSSFP